MIMKKVFKNLLLGASVVAVSGAVATYTAYNVSSGVTVQTVVDEQAGTFVTKASMPAALPDGVQRTDLTDAAEKSIHAVVHIKSTAKGKTAVVRRAPDIYLAGGVVRAGAGAASTVVMMLVPIIVFVISQSKILETMATSGMKD